MAFYSPDKILYILIVTFMLTNSAYCWARGYTATHPDYPNKCYYAGPPVHIMEIGSKRRLTTDCAYIECKKNSFIYEEGCTIQVALPSLYKHCSQIAPDVTKPFPECCYHEQIC